MALRLITIPISHYCDKARWALELADLSYQEDAHLQVFHYLATARVGGGPLVPVLVADDEVIAGSATIVRWADQNGADRRGKVGLVPSAHAAEIDRLEHDFDERLGPSGRLWMYYQVLPHRELVEAYACSGVPAWQQRMLRPAYGFVDRFIRWRLDIDEPAVIEARREVLRVFDDVAKRLADGRRYLVGDAFSAADLAFAALAAPCVLPPQYGVPLPPIDELPNGYRKEVAALREHPAGQFALRMYREHRMAPTGRAVAA
jgi:glutathione S-transferase